jgi:hypothetical protein
MILTALFMQFLCRGHVPEKPLVAMTFAGGRTRSVTIFSHGMTKRRAAYRDAVDSAPFHILAATMSIMPSHGTGRTAGMPDLRRDNMPADSGHGNFSFVSPDRIHCTIVRRVWGCFCLLALTNKPVGAPYRPRRMGSSIDISYPYLFFGAKHK